MSVCYVWIQREPVFILLLAKQKAIGPRWDSWPLEPGQSAVADMPRPQEQSPAPSFPVVTPTRLAGVQHHYRTPNRHWWYLASY